MVDKGMRWITVTACGQPNLEITFVKAEDKEKLKALGKHAGDHVFLTLEPNDCFKDYETMKAKGVKFLGKPDKRPYGIEVLFKDIYGNLFDLI